MLARWTEKLAGGSEAGWWIRSWLVDQKLTGGSEAGRSDSPPPTSKGVVREEQQEVQYNRETNYTPMIYILNII